MPTDVVTTHGAVRYALSDDGLWRLLIPVPVDSDPPRDCECEGVAVRLRNLQASDSSRFMEVTCRDEGLRMPSRILSGRCWAGSRPAQVPMWRCLRSWTNFVGFFFLSHLENQIAGNRQILAEEDIPATHGNPLLGFQNSQPRAADVRQTHLGAPVGRQHVPIRQANRSRRTEGNRVV